MKLFKNSWCLWQTTVFPPWIVSAETICGNTVWGNQHGSCWMDIKVRIEKKTQEKEEKAKMPNGTSTKLFRQTLIDGHLKSQRQGWNCLDQEVGTDSTMVGGFCLNKRPKRRRNQCKVEKNVHIIIGWISNQIV